MQHGRRRHLSLGLHSLSDQERRLHRLEDLLDRLADKRRQGREPQTQPAQAGTPQAGLAIGGDAWYDDSASARDEQPNLSQSESHISGPAHDEEH